MYTSGYLEKKALDDRINIWNGSFLNLDDTNCFKFELKQKNGVAHKCLLSCQIPDKTPYLLKHKLLRILQRFGLKKTEVPAIATENMLELEPELVGEEEVFTYVNDEGPYEENPYIGLDDTYDQVPDDTYDQVPSGHFDQLEG